MMEIIQFVGQDINHVFGTIVVTMFVSVALAIIITAIGYAIGNARGFTDEEGDHSHGTQG